MKKLLISIIIPTYNSGQTICSCIESILNQDYINYEIIIIDNISTDNTLFHLKKYNDPRIKIYVEPDDGIYDAMNKGIKYSNGEWLYFLGSDDLLYTNDILRTVDKIISTKDVSIIYGNVLNEQTNSIYDGEFNLEKLKKQNICHQAIFIKKDIFDIIGGFNLKYPVCADWEHNIKWFLNPNIKHLYTNNIIAQFAKGGVSSTRGDIKFSIHLRWNFIKYNKDNIRLREKCKIVINEIIYCIKNKQERALINILKEFLYYLI